MGTRAYIGVKNNNGTITAAYNQCDGGLDNLGHILRKHFKSEEQVRELVAFGEISSVQDYETYEYCKNKFSSFDDSEWKDLQNTTDIKVHLMPCSEQPEELNDINEVMGCMINYAYLFDPEENKWYYTKGKDLSLLKS
jgi:hypothetical protein